MRAYLKELGGQIASDESEETVELSGENSGDPIRDLLQCIEASDVCWKEVSNDIGKEADKDVLYVTFASRREEVQSLFVFKNDTFPIPLTQILPIFTTQDIFLFIPTCRSVKN